MEKLAVLSSKVNCFERGIKVQLKINKDIKYGDKYTHIKYWVESKQNEKTGRIQQRLAWSRYNSYLEQWCEQSKGKYYPFVALAYNYKVLNILYVNSVMHSSYINDYLDKYNFDKKQTNLLITLLNIRSLVEGNIVGVI